MDWGHNADTIQLGSTVARTHHVSTRALLALAEDLHGNTILRMRDNPVRATRVSPSLTDKQGHLLVLDWTI